MTEIFSIRELGEVTIVDVLTELDRTSTLSMKLQLRSLIINKPNIKLVINFSNVNHINNRTISALIGIKYIMRAQNGDLCLCCVKSHIERIFNLIGAHKILKIYKTEQEAVESFTKMEEENE